MGFETDETLYQNYKFLFDFLENTILVLFVVELVLQVFVFNKRPIDYFKSAWNVFDFLIVLLCILPIFITNENVLAISTLRIFRLARTLRIFRLFSKLTALKSIVEALVKSLPAMGYVTLLLLTVFFVYGVIGVQLFRKIDPEHFGSLYSACLTLFKIVTGAENWSLLMDKSLLTIQYIPVLYYVSFFIIAGLIILNLFVSVLVTELSKIREK